MIGIRKLRLGKSRVVYKPGEVAGEECLKELPYMIFNGPCFSDAFRFGGGQSHGLDRRCGIRIEPSYGVKMNCTQQPEVKYVYVGDDENREITLVLGDDSF